MMDTTEIIIIRAGTDKAVPDGSVSNIRSLIHLVILQSLGDTTSSKEPYRQTHRHT